MTGSDAEDSGATADGADAARVCSAPSSSNEDRATDKGKGTDAVRTCAREDGIEDAIEGPTDAPPSTDPSPDPDPEP